MFKNKIYATMILFAITISFNACQSESSSASVASETNILYSTDSDLFSSGVVVGDYSIRTYKISKGYYISIFGPNNYVYDIVTDANGRLTGFYVGIYHTEAPSNSARVTKVSYDSSGYVESITDNQNTYYPSGTVSAKSLSSSICDNISDTVCEKAVKPLSIANNNPFEELKEAFINNDNSALNNIIENEKNRFETMSKNILNALSQLNTYKQKDGVTWDLASRELKKYFQDIKDGKIDESYSKLNPIDITKDNANSTSDTSTTTGDTSLSDLSKWWIDSVNDYGYFNSDNTFIYLGCKDSDSVCGNITNNDFYNPVNNGANRFTFKADGSGSWIEYEYSTTNDTSKPIVCEGEFNWGLWYQDNGEIFTEPVSPYDKYVLTIEPKVKVSEFHEYCTIYSMDNKFDLYNDKDRGYVSFSYYKNQE